MSQCTEALCRFEADDEQEFAIDTGEQKPLVFRGCPRRHVDTLTREWIAAHAQFKTFGRTPVELGLCEASELDPRWYEAVMAIETHVKRLEVARSKRPAAGGAR